MNPHIEAGTRTLQAAVWCMVFVAVVVVAAMVSPILAVAFAPISLVGVWSLRTAP